VAVLLPALRDSREDGSLPRLVADQLPDPSAPPGEVQSVFGDVVGKVGQPSILPALCYGLLSLALQTHIHNKLNCISNPACIHFIWRNQT